MLRMLRDFWTNRKLIWKLAKNDFKTRYAGSYFGVVWAMVQPVVIVLVYWFVFQIGLNNATAELKQCPLFSGWSAVSYRGFIFQRA